MTGNTLNWEALTLPGPPKRNQSYQIGARTAVNFGPNSDVDKLNQFSFILQTLPGRNRELALLVRELLVDLKLISVGGIVNVLRVVLVCTAFTSLQT